MAYEQRDMSGSLFPNTRKTSDSHANVTGSGMIGGVEYWISAWTKTKQDGSKWMSLSFKEKNPTGASIKANAVVELDGDEIPF